MALTIISWHAMNPSVLVRQWASQESGIAPLRLLYFAFNFLLQIPGS